MEINIKIWKKTSKKQLTHKSAQLVTMDALIIPLNNID